MRYTLLFVAILIWVALFLPTLVFGFERESYYSDLLCEQWGGEETTLQSGIRPDCETEFVVIEVDWSKRPKHYECIGQALIYAQQTGKFPVCVLLAKTDEEEEFGNSLNFTDMGIALRIVRIYE